MERAEGAAPVPRRLFTPGASICLGLALLGVACGVYRFAFGLHASTNLSQQYPWGIWIVADVSFIALAAGGFVTAAVAHILHRHDYHALVRPALLVAVLGYTCACILLAADLGRYYNIWHPILPSMWQGNSALFEVGMCVMAYLTVLYLEFVPVLCQRFSDAGRRGWVSSLCAVTYRVSGKVMFLLIILGVAISCLHQSSLGHVMVLAPTKLHPLWWTPALALLFLMSAVVVGLPTVLFASIAGAWSLGLRPPMQVLSRAARFIPLLLFIYLSFKVGDLVVREAFVHLADLTPWSLSFLAEILIGVVVPMSALLSTRVRSSAGWLGAACLLAMFGVVLNRANVYWLGYRPQSATTFYTPSLVEIGFTLGVAAGLIFLWRAVAIAFPVINANWQGPAAGPRAAARDAALRSDGQVPTRTDASSDRRRQARSGPPRTAEPALTGR